MLTRSQVATMLGKSIATVRRMEGHELHPKRNRAGVHLFDPDEVRAVRSGTSILRVIPESQRLHRHAWPEPHRDEKRDTDAESGQQAPHMAPEQLAQLLRAARAEGAKEERVRLDAERTLEQAVASRQRDAEEQALARVKA